jgi:glycosyltransferase involved in cell wall biosynthesis
MLLGKKIAVTMPAYYAEKTVAKTYADIPLDYIDTVILVDDSSKDNTFAAAQALGISTYRNETNKNYGGNVKRCLQLALDAGADIVIQLHPDYQYPPKLTLPMAAMLATGYHDLCLGVRTSGKGARDTMPFWRYLPNRVLTVFMGWCFGVSHSEFHTGYRAYTRKLLETVPFHELRDDFIFDNQMLIAALRHDFATCEVTCPTVYEEDSSSIPFSKAVRYGLQCLKISIPFFFERLGKGKGSKNNTTGPAA